MDIRLQPVRQEDEAFPRSVYASTRADELALTGWGPAFQADFLVSQYDAQQRYYRSQFATAEVRIVQCEDRDVGRLITECTETEIRLIDVALLPQYRGNGIGTFLLTSLMEDAGREGKSIRLRVEQSNRALHWYRSLGFDITDEPGLYVAMAWTADAGASATRSELRLEQDSAMVRRE